MTSSIKIMRGMSDRSEFKNRTGPKCQIGHGHTARVARAGGMRCDAMAARAMCADATSENSRTAFSFVSLLLEAQPTALCLLPLALLLLLFACALRLGKPSALLLFLSSLFHLCFERDTLFSESFGRHESDRRCGQLFLNR